MEIFICNICKKEYNNILGLSRHSVLAHKMTSEETYVMYMLNGIKPKCECGCGMDSPFITINKGFSRFVQSHHNRVPGKNNFHKNPETHKKALATQKENWKLGKYKGWWENNDEETRQKIEGIKNKLRNNKERGRKISNSLTGVPKTEESKRNSSNSQKERYKNNPQLGIDASKRRIEWLKRKQKGQKTKIEQKFEIILSLIGLKNIFQYEFNHRLFDFYLIDYNILIEVDGNFHHNNPKMNYTFLYESQKLSIKNDDFKNKLCQDNGVVLLRYWEKDINERPEWVISDLKEKLDLTENFTL